MYFAAMSKKRTRTRLSGIVLALCLLLIAGCAGGGGNDPAPSNSGANGGSNATDANPLAGLENVPALAEAATDDEKQRIATLIQGARAEGAFSWYGTMIEPDHGEKILTAFKEYYGLQNVKTEYTYASPGEMVTKVEELLRAGRYDLDVVWNTAYSWFKDLHSRDMLLAYESPEYAGYTISHDMGASNSPYWVSDSYSFHPMYNAKIMAEVMGPDWKPTSWNDFVDPRLKDLVSMGDMMLNESHAGMAQGVIKVMGREYFENVKAILNPVVFARASQGRDWVATGEYPVTLSSHAKNAATLKDRGEDGIVLVYPSEGIMPLPFTLAILKSAPHPNAAKLFVDFARSIRGQETVVNSGALIFSGRPGVASPEPELLPPSETIKFVPIDWNTEGTEAELEKVRQIWREIGLDR